MFPLGHLAFGYLSYVLIRLARQEPLPQGWLLLTVLVGTQIPDIIDKPLSYVGILPSGRSLGHSVLVIAPILVVVVLWAHREGHTEYAIAGSVGLLSHYVGDVYKTALTGDWWSMRFLLWPLYPVSPSDGTPPWIRVIESSGDPQYRAQNALAVFAVLLWAANKIWRAQRNSGTEGNQ
ncbi:metal-dependent hydrolase [Haloferax sp. MBLA0078]|uniref:Metal-dependent hydrolase n=1 Tax=Haloferax marinum TaxID=2666143 RepID=A0A6A8G8B8_9EURY|nr:metal-dependent hydrolase [Haloferax sp. CBA1150]MRW97314.1 metal-dependent hydrolase [Haloferax marinum]